MSDYGIKWLASYPKSGNTWARLFLLTYLKDPDEPIPPDELGKLQFSPSCDAAWLWELATGVAIADPPKDGKGNPIKPFSDDSYMRLRTHVQQFYLRKALTQGVPAFMKTHAVNQPYKGDFPIIDWGATQSAVYFVRDPRSVAPSYAAHMGKTYAKAMDDMADQNNALMKNYGIPCPILSWVRNVTSWKDKATVIKYEDLPDGFEAMLETFGLPRDERFEKAVAFTKLETVKTLEKEHGFGEASRHTKGFFGQKHRPLNRQQRRRIASENAEMMLAMGYDDAAEEVGKAA